MKTIGVVPAYGRDYKSKREVAAAIEAGHDFTVSDFTNPYCGRSVDASDARGAGYEGLRVRYDRLRKQAVFPLMPATKTGALR